jgi:hypothetical protein
MYRRAGNLSKQKGPRMRQVSLLFSTIMVAMVLAGGVALAAIVTGTSADDTLNGTHAKDEISGYEGNDTIYAKGSADVLWSGPGSDVSNGEGANDTIHGEGGNDTLYGNAGNDELRGGDGTDVLNGGVGDDRLNDAGGDPAERDRFNCADGIDTVTADATDRVTSTCEIVNAPGGDLLPDLGMAPISSIQIQNTTDGRRELRFGTTIVNVGDGDFELRGQRPDTATEMTVDQRIFDSAGDYRERSTTAKMFYSGDGHDHWHVKDLEDYELLSNGNKVASGSKIGFCFWDNVNYGATTAERYIGCANRQPGALAVTMGLSRGWGDVYGSNLLGQYVDTTGLPDGEYRLQVTADKPNWFLEKDETNNVTWADLRIVGNTVTVLAYGPSAPPIG